MNGAFSPGSSCLVETAGTVDIDCVTHEGSLGMKSSIRAAPIASIGLVAAVAATASIWIRDAVAADRGEAAEHLMQAVPTTAAPGEPGYRWRYFSDTRGHRAVVISPDGDYYFSRGKGLNLIAQQRDGDTRALGVDDGMQAVPNAATAGQPGHAWRYFSDARAHRAVVISPAGDYYFSRGDGLRLIAQAQGDR